jgi:hypothetical protein
MESWKKSYTWCSPKATKIRNIKIMFANSRKPFMAWSKPKRFGIEG